MSDLHRNKTLLYDLLIKAICAHALSVGTDLERLPNLDCLDVIDELYKIGLGSFAVEALTFTENSHLFSNGGVDHE